MSRVKVSHSSRLMFLSKSFFLLALLIFPGFVSSALAISVSLSITSVEKSDEKKGYVVKGEVTASDLNPKGQIVESDSMTIFADIKIDSASVYQELPEGMYIRKPAGCESSYTKGKKCMTLKEEQGVGISRGVVSGLGDIRMSPVWRAYGGLGVWNKKAPKSVTKTFEGVIPFTRQYKGKQIQVEGKQVRIRATLQHRWGGPYAPWPAFSFHHDIAFEGLLGDSGMSVDQKDKDEDGVSDDFDKCCKTPKGHKVDALGCSICPSGTIYDPESPFVDQSTGCSPKVAVIFTTKTDPNITWRHELAENIRIKHIKSFYKEKGYKILEVSLKGDTKTITQTQRSFNRLTQTFIFTEVTKYVWTMHINEFTTHLVRPSTKAIAYFGHGGFRKNERLFWWGDYESSLDHHRMTPIINSAALKREDYLMKYNCLSKEEARIQAYEELIKKGGVGLDYAYIFACHSSDDNILRDFLISSTGRYWGEPGILTGTMPLKQVTGRSK